MFDDISIFKNITFVNIIHVHGNGEIMCTPATDTMFDIKTPPGTISLWFVNEFVKTEMHLLNNYKMYKTICHYLESVQ